MILSLLLTWTLALQSSSSSALELLRAGRAPEALELLSSKLQADEENADLRREAIELAFGLKRWNDVLAWTAGRPELKRERARALFFAGRYEAALELLDQADQRQVFLALDALEALGRLKEHDDLLARTSAKIGVEDPRVATAEGRVALRKRLYAHAIECFERARAREPWRLDALFGLGRARLLSGEREAGLQLLNEHRRLVPLFDQLDFAERGVELDPTHGPNHARVGDLERTIGRLGRAELAYRRALGFAQGADRTPIVLRLARFLTDERSNAKQAIELLVAETRSGFDPRLLVRLGDRYAADGDRVQALATYRRVLAQRPNDAAVLRRVEELAR